MYLKHVEQIDREERQELSWWKIKKWAIRILNRIFDRYGTPANCSKEYSEFANFFLKGYSSKCLFHTFRLILDKTRKFK